MKKRIVPVIAILAAVVLAVDGKPQTLGQRDRDTKPASATTSVFAMGQ